MKKIMNEDNKGKLLASARYRQPMLTFFGMILIVVGLALPLIIVLIVFGDFTTFLNYQGSRIDSIMADEDGLIFLIFPVFALLIGVLVMRARISIHVYDTHIMCRWASLVKAARVEYNEITDVKIVRDETRWSMIGGLLSVFRTVTYALEIHLDKSRRGPKSITYVIAGKRSQFNKEKAQQIMDIILQKTGKKS